MYFQTLENIKNLDGVPITNPKIIEELDVWLATRRISIINNLTPQSFANFSGISDSMALELFVICEDEKIGLLRARFDIFIKKTNQAIASYYEEDAIPTTYLDPEDGCIKDINIDEDIRIYFELLQEPISEPDIVIQSSSKEGAKMSAYRNAKKKSTPIISDILKNLK